MLKLLEEYAHKHGIVTEPGFAPKTVRWAILFRENGEFSTVIELGDVGDKRNRGEEFPCCPDLTQPQLIADGVTRSHFLVDTAEVVAFLGQEAQDDDKVRAKHDYFITQLHEAGREVPELARLATALADPSVIETVRTALADQKAKPADKVTVGFGRPLPIESDAWHDWWRRYLRTFNKQDAAGGTMRCLVTGGLVSPAPTHPKIQGLADVGAQPSGAALIGFDKEAFTSYGLAQSANAAVSAEAAAAYRAALNDLIANHAQRLAGAKVVHWFKERIPPEDDVLALLTAQTSEEQQEASAQQRASELLQAIERGERPDLAGNRFYALTLSGSGGRVMVRDWMEGEFRQLARNIRAWFDDLSIVHRQGGNALAPSPKFLAVLAATARELDEVPAPLAAKMWRVALQREPIPHTALAHALARVRVDIIDDAVPNHARMGLLRAYHVRKYRSKGEEAMAQEMKPFLNENHPSPAYHCGRLLAVYAALQRAALGDVGAGVIQRYYAAASATPALVLGRLARISQFHLNKLESGGLAYWYEQTLAGIWQRLGDEPPRTLDLEEQSLFALGYYQQLADLRTKKQDRPVLDTADTTPKGDDTNG